METRAGTKTRKVGSRILAAVAMILGSLALITPASAFTYVPSFGATGWQNLSIPFESPESGKIGFLVSDHGDTDAQSWLLIDNLKLTDSVGAVVVKGFESGDLTGFTLDGVGSAVTTSSYGPGTYAPTGGSYMAEISSSDGDTGFADLWGSYAGTDASILWFSFSSTDDIMLLSFDWNFNTTDYDPYLDYSLAVLLDGQGSLVGLYELGRIQGGPQPVIPEPSTVLLFSAGLAGLGLWGRKRMKKA